MSFNYKDYAEKIIDYVEETRILISNEMDLQRTYHACQIHGDESACKMLDRKKELVRGDKKNVESMKNRLKW